MDISQAMTKGNTDNSQPRTTKLIAEYTMWNRETGLMGTLDLARLNDHDAMALTEMR